MRDWVVNLVDALEENGKNYLHEMVLGDFRFTVYNYPKDSQNVLQIINRDMDRACEIKLYEDEYDLLLTVKRKLRLETEDLFINIFNNFKHASN